MSKYTVLMAAGGTGGHVYPAIAIAQAIRKLIPSAEIVFAGTKTHMEWQAVPKAGFPILPIWVSGFHRQLTFKNLLFPFKLLVSLMQSLLILLKVKPDVVICCGGYVSGPVGRMASFLGKPLMLQEQNSFPGVTNRLLGKGARKIFTAFPEATNWFPASKVMMLGNPVRAGLDRANRAEAALNWGFDTSIRTILVMGGSGGAKSINEAMVVHLNDLHNRQKLQIIWQCGKNYMDDIKAKIDTTLYPNLRLTAFLDNMSEAYAVSDLVICRAGAGTIAELLTVGKASLLVPSPYVAGDHQTKNAASIVAMGAAEILNDSDLTEKLASTIAEMVAAPPRLAEMGVVARSNARPNAATDIAEAILGETKPELLNQNLAKP